MVRQAIVHGNVSACRWRLAACLVVFCADAVFQQIHQVIIGQRVVVRSAYGGLGHSGPLHMRSVLLFWGILARRRPGVRRCARWFVAWFMDIQVVWGILARLWCTVGLWCNRG